jgi:Na+/H+ antiporter NhaC
MPEILVVLVAELLLIWQFQRQASISSTFTFQTFVNFFLYGQESPRIRRIWREKVSLKPRRIGSIVQTKDGMAVMYSFLLITCSFLQWKGGGRRSTTAKLAIHWIIAALVVIAAFAFHSGPVHGQALPS